MPSECLATDAVRLEAVAPGVTFVLHGGPTQSPGLSGQHRWCFLGGFSEPLSSRLIKLLRIAGEQARFFSLSIFQKPQTFSHDSHQSRKWKLYLRIWMALS